MTFDPEIHHRRSIRLKRYDYSQTGAYFVTICINDRDHLFGEVVGDQMTLKEAGHMVERWWAETNNRFPGVHVDSRKRAATLGRPYIGKYCGLV